MNAPVTKDAKPVFGPNGEVVEVGGRTFPAFARKEIHPVVASILEKMPRGTLLDLPAGSGSLSWRLRLLGFDVTAADLCPEYFLNPEIPIVKADIAAAFPFPDSSFDYATFIEGPEHVENTYHAFREFYRILKPGGRLVVSIPNYSNLQSRIKNLFYGSSEPIVSGEDRKREFAGNEHMIHINRPSYPLLRMALEYAGFRVASIHQDKVKPKQMLWYPLFLVIRLLAAVKGRRGEKRYWMNSANVREVLLGGNTLIVLAIKQPAD